VISSARCTNEENYHAEVHSRRDGHEQYGLLRPRLSFPDGLGDATIPSAPARPRTRWWICNSTNCIMVIRREPDRGPSVTGAKIKQRAMKGVPLIVIDPRKIELRSLRQRCHLQLRPGNERRHAQHAGSYIESRLGRSGVHREALRELGQIRGRAALARDLDELSR